ncbi:MAG: sigma-54-dependent Fis family transcriptional regulator [Deltaproteobacteria bacterium]|nr:sigma-54-dependent Fis family transcriptional regulator [Deltaproteobacteria bacterium]
MRAAPSKRILVVDDEPQIRSFLKNLFEMGGWDVHEALSGTEGIEKIERERYDVILTDLKMPGADGIEILRTAKKIQSDAEVVVMTGYGTVDSAIEAMRAGAFHFLLKPFRAEEVRHLVDKAYHQRRLKRENLFLKAEARGQYQVSAIVGTSPAVQEAVSRAQQLADTDTPVLIEGEHGTGRGFLARILHYQSSRAGGLFVPVACGGLQEELLESELFGYARGAFQQALLPRSGKAELADRGTLYLADIDGTGLPTQEKILRLLTEKTVTPVGGSRDIEIDVRLVASAAASLEEAAGGGSFLPALRDALLPGRIHLPPLRERIEDIPLLLHHYLFEGNRMRKKPLRGFSDAAIAALTGYPWQGNVRELVEVVSYIAGKKRQGSVVDAADLPAEIWYGRSRPAPAGEPPSKPIPDIREAIQDLDRQMLRQALALSDGDPERAAALLNLDVAVLEKLMRETGIEWKSGPS